MTLSVWVWCVRCERTQKKEQTSNRDRVKTQCDRWKLPFEYFFSFLFSDFSGSTIIFFFPRMHFLWCRHFWFGARRGRRLVRQIWSNIKKPKLNKVLISLVEERIYCQLSSCDRLCIFCQTESISTRIIAVNWTAEYKMQSGEVSNWRDVEKWEGKEEHCAKCKATTNNESGHRPAQD